LIRDIVDEVFVEDYPYSDYA